MSSDVRPLALAVPAGALLEGSLDLLARAGVARLKAAELGRRLMVDTGDGPRLILVRPADVPIYVDSGAADLGLVGKDTLWESPGSRYELADLAYGGCRLVMAVPQDSAIEGRDTWPPRMRIATKYPRRAADFLRGQAQLADLVRLHGSIELAPQVGLVDAIIDITATGRTLAENRLRVVAEIDTSTARLVANEASLKTRSRQVQEMAGRLIGVAR
jgi:ATP phosphoribosyltransferase